MSTDAELLKKAIKQLLGKADDDGNDIVENVQHKCSLKRVCAEDIPWLYDLTHDENADKKHVILIQKHTIDNNNSMSNSLKNGPIYDSTNARNVAVIPTTTNLAEGDSLDSSNMFSVDGSPLRLNAIADLSSARCMSVTNSVAFDEDALQYFPVSVKEAYHILSVLGNVESLNIPVVILCDANSKRSQKIAAVAYETEKDKKDRQFQKRSTITLSGPYSKDNLAKADCLRELFSAKHIKYYAEYDVIGTLSQDNPKAGLQGSVKIQMKWNRNTPVLGPPPSDAEAIVKLQIATGDPQGAVYELWSELDVVKRLVASVSTGEMIWLERDTSESLTDMLAKLFERLKRGDTHAGRKESVADVTWTEDRLQLEDSKDADFTDMLWKILKNSSSYAELVRCLQFIFNEIRRGVLKPLVHKANKTKMANLVRLSYAEAFTTPSLAVGSEVIHLLAEMGAEKLRRDYMNIFLSQDMTTATHLDSFVAPDIVLDDKVIMLEKLHNVLEVVAMLKTYLHSPQNTLSVCARQTLNYYRTNKLDPKHVFTVAIPALSISSLLENAKPSLWRAVATKTVQEKQESCVILLKTNFPFNHISVTDFQCISPSNIFSYYMVKLKESIVYI